MKYIVSALLVVFSFFTLIAQDGGARAYAGVTSASNRAALVTPKGMTHAGYHVGIDARLNGGGMFFNFGVRYSKIDLVATSGSDFFSNTTNHGIFSARGGLGFFLARWGDNMALRTKLLGQLDFHSGDSDAIANRVPYNGLIDTSAGAVTGLAFDFKFLTADLEYEYGLVHSFRDQKDAKYDVITFSLGFFF